MFKRGRVQRDTSQGNGVISVEGKQYELLLEGMWRSELPPRLGMLVDVQFGIDGTPEAVSAVSESQIAREQAEQALAGAKRQGAAIAGQLRSRFGLPVIAAELLLLVSFFLLPAISVGGDYGRQSFNGWDAIGFNVNTMSPNDHGVLSLLAILSLFAPLAVPFLHRPWVRWLYAAPLAFSVLGTATLLMEITGVSRAATHEITQTFGSAAASEISSGAASMLHLGLGAVLTFAFSLYLATRVVRN